MARAAKHKSKDEIEVIFGFKQVLGLALLTAVVLSGTFFWGFAAGHRRALRGEPSPLAFLDKGADPHDAPVDIPDVLLKQVDEAPSSDSSADAAESSAPNQTSGTPPAPGRTPVAQERVKPSPGTAPNPAARQAVVPKSATPKAATKPPEAAKPPAARSAPGRKIHYQVAALRVRKNAKQLVDWLRSEGFPAMIQPASDGGLYRVLVGPFRNEAEAASARNRLGEDGFKPMPRSL